VKTQKTLGQNSAFMPTPVSANRKAGTAKRYGAVRYRPMSRHRQAFLNDPDLLVICPAAAPQYRDR
jgi:hypothetical protein